VGVIGIFQPFSDGIKLFSNESIFFSHLNLNYYFLCPIILFFISLRLWLLFPYYFNLFRLELGVLLFFCILSINVYPIIIIGWASNSIYARLGALRSISQTISYEIRLILLILSPLVLIEELRFLCFFEYQKYTIFFILLSLLSLMLFTSLLVELNRTPFDLVEGESELVSWFNVEYISGGFALIFLGEYSNIILLILVFLFNKF